MKKRGFRLFPKSMKSKHDWGDKVYVSGIYECSLCGNYQAFKKGENFSECQDCINSNREEENKWYATNELVYFISKNINMEFDRIQTVSIRVADAITEYAGTISFFLVHVIWFSIWIMVNRGVFGQAYVFDPFPFGLLTMIVSLEAIFLSTFILMSQNIAAQKSEMRSEHEYQVNLETEKNVAEILAMVKDIRAEGNIRTEHIEDLKETVEEISEHIELDANQDEAIKAKSIDAQEEKEEKEEFEEHEKLLDEIGIDVIPESAPPVILEEEEVIDRDHLKKEEKSKKQRKSKSKKTSKTSTKSKSDKKSSKKSKSKTNRKKTKTK